MILKKFKIEIYEWKVTFIEITSKKDWKKVNKIQKGFGVDKNTIKETRMHIKAGSKDGGLHSWNRFRKSIILLYPSSSMRQRIKVICHEKRHCEDRILEHLRVYGVEAPAYLAGYLSKKLI